MNAVVFVFRSIVDRYFNATDYLWIGSIEKEREREYDND